MSFFLKIRVVPTLVAGTRCIAHDTLGETLAVHKQTFRPWAFATDHLFLWLFLMLLLYHWLLKCWFHVFHVTIVLNNRVILKILHFNCGLALVVRRVYIMVLVGNCTGALRAALLKLLRRKVSRNGKMVV